jgi:hypothetical protein
MPIATRPAKTKTPATPPTFETLIPTPNLTNSDAAECSSPIARGPVSSVRANYRRLNSLLRKVRRRSGGKQQTFSPFPASPPMRFAGKNWGSEGSTPSVATVPVSGGGVNTQAMTSSGPAEIRVGARRGCSSETPDARAGSPGTACSRTRCGAGRDLDNARAGAATAISTAIARNDEVASRSKSDLPHCFTSRTSLCRIVVYCPNEWV